MESAKYGIVQIARTGRIDWHRKVCRLGAFVVGTMMSMIVMAEDPAILGYSPVSYFEKGIAERGSAEFAVTHDRVVYFLTSARQVELFNEDPTHYVPTFGAYCPYNLTLGRRAEVDPENFKIVAGHLLLFHRTGEMDGREAWDSHGNDDELLRKAKREWVLLRF